MDNDRLTKTNKTYSARDTVIVAIWNHRKRRHIAEGFRQLGDKVVDWYGEAYPIPFSSMFILPHRLVVMGYSDFKRHEAAILLYLSRAKNPTPPILIYGRHWRKIPDHPSIIDGDDISADQICKMFWDARGKVFIRGLGDQK
jgi:hypothetical protein